MHSLANQKDFGVDRNLLKAVAEELKMPLTRIARLTELGLMEADHQKIQDYLRIVEHNTDIAMQLLESYLIGLSLVDSKQLLDLSPVSIGSVLNDTAHKLSGMANDYNVDIEVMIYGRQRLVMANARGLRAAFLNLGSTLIVSQPQSRKKRSIRLESHPRENAMMAGVYGNQNYIVKKTWERAQKLYGQARQPLQELSATSGAGLFVADAILRAMSSQIRPAKYRNQNGLAVRLSLSQQLQLV